LKDIIIIANFVGDLQGTDNNRFPYLACVLSGKANVELVTSSFNHSQKKHRGELYKYPFDVTLIDEPGYEKNVSLRRFWSHYVWGKNVFKYIKSRKKPDLVYCAMPSLTASSLVSDYCKKNNIRFVVDVQDLWPEAFQMVFNIPVVSRIFFAPFNRLANIAYRNADEIVAVSRTYVNRAVSVSQHCKQGTAVFIGTNLDFFDENVANNPVPEKEMFQLAYCGTLGNSYDLTCVFDALKLLKDDGIDNIKFLIMGDGLLRQSFENYAKKLNLNVEFTGKLPYAQMCARLASSDAAVNPIVAGSAASIINKHADYASAGIPVLNTQESKEYCDLVDEYKMGFNCENGNPMNLAEKIKILVNDTSLRKMMGKNARKCAKEKFDRKFTYNFIVDIIL